MFLYDALVERKLCLELRQARGLILAGKVLVNDEVISKAGFKVTADDKIRIRNQKRWVARSAEKLLGAINEFDFTVKGLTFLDIGSSTGGFTEVLLQRGAKSVICLDVSYGFLHAKIRNNPAVSVLERKNIMKLETEVLPYLPERFVADVSFISIEKVLSHLRKIFTTLEGIVLFKPQFEAAKEQLTKGIVKDKHQIELLQEKFAHYLQATNIENMGMVPASIKGTKGNQEFLYHLKW